MQNHHKALPDIERGQQSLNSTFTLAKGKDQGLEQGGGREGKQGRTQDITLKIKIKDHHWSESVPSTTLDLYGINNHSFMPFCAQQYTLVPFLWNYKLLNDASTEE